MATRIQILPEQLCNQIAAGEVVERPASVVKELLENSLDAGASEIRIEIEQGGRRLIRITDDGEGMGREDVMLCLERHATSKIRHSEDLFRIGTLGFRGEALPSIAAVSRMTLRSRNAEDEAGWEVAVEGGAVRRAGAVSSPQGTQIEVRDLFFNLPARRKFLRKDETELGHIGDVVTRLAMAHTDVQFRLFHQGRALLEVPRHPRLEERVAVLLGRPVLTGLTPLDRSAGGFGLRGLVGSPDAARATSGGIYTYINGRFIRDRVVQHALLDGYRHLLPRGRYPVAVLFLTIDPGQVDVNVHPTKHEVRFREQGAVHAFIAGAVAETLSATSWLQSSAKPSPAAVAAAASQSPVAEQRLFEVRESLAAYVPREERSIFPSAGSAPTPPRPEHRAETERLPEPVPEQRGYYRSLRIIGQFRRSYLVAQDGDDLVLIDQHAAHERIGFERLRHQWGEGRIERQALLFPRVFRLDMREGAHLVEHLDDLDRLGFEVEPFGGQDFALKSHPRLVEEGQAEGLVRDVAAELAQLGCSTLADDALDAILIRMACHGMIRANQELAPAEIDRLLHDLDLVGFGSHCPHGRPVLYRISLPEIERIFKRG